MPTPQYDAVNTEYLDKIIEKLERSPQKILKLSGLNLPRNQWKAEDIEIWRAILRQAQDRIKEQSPGIRDYATNIGSLTTTILGVAMTAPPLGIAAGIAVTITAIGSVGTIWSGASVISKDTKVIERYAKIEEAKRIMEERLSP